MRLFICILLLTSTGISLIAQPLRYKANVKGKPERGYYFLVSYKVSKDINEAWAKGYRLILDEKGDLVYYEKTGKCFDFKILPAGRLYYFMPDKFYLLNSSFMIIDSIACKYPVTADEHDFQVLPNGHYLFMGTEIVQMDLRANRMFLKNKRPGIKNANVKCGVIVEMDANKKTVFEWHAKDHFKFDDVDEFFINDTLNVDWTHFNSVELDRDGNLLVSIKNFNEITKINRKNGKIIWRMGGKRNQFRFINDTLAFYTQHDARRMANGHITLLDNGWSDSSRNHIARALEYEVNETKRTAKLVWSYVRNPPVYSPGTGNMQRLPNGSSLVDFGKVANDNIMFELVNARNEPVFSIQFDDSLSTYRAYHYPASAIQLKRPVIKATQVGNAWELDAGAGYRSCHWSNGRASRKIKVGEPGNYFVDVPIGNGGFIRSKVYGIKLK